jgi:glycosidase
MPRRLFKTLTRQRHRWKQRWFMRPFRLLLEHPAYWTLNRRSVTRAFALGLFISFVPLPIHIIVATALAIALRLNIPAAVAGTFLANPLTLVPFLGNHDVQRFMNEPGATADGLKLAYTFLLTVRGTPLLYYGDEIALPGAGDPDNRRDFPGGWPGDARTAFEADGRTPAEESVFSHVQRLLTLRAERRDLRRAPMQHLYASEQAFVYRRGRSVVALNNDTAAATIRLPGVTLGEDALGICARPVADSGAAVVVVPRRAGCVF